MAPLQKRALIVFLIGLAFSLALAVVLALEGDVTAIDREANLRYATYAVLIGVPLSYLILIDLSLRKPTELDERDKLIIMRSGRVQWVAVVFSLAAWTIALTEAYWAERQVPIVFINLIFISILIISILAQTAGILLGYWSMNRRA
jgi:hypothetical protein